MKNKIERKEDGNKQKVEKYIERYLPDYIKDKKYQSFSYKALKKMKTNLVDNVQGLENIPKGEKLFIAEHDEGEDIWKLLVALDEKIHIVASETIHQKDKLLFGAKGIIMEWLEMLPIRETFSNVEIQNKEEIIGKAPFLERAAHRRILNRPRNQEMGNLKHLRSIVAVLLAGQSVELFVDGPWTRLGDDKRMAYAGYGMIAKMYEKLTGRKLNIIPVSFQGTTVIIGNSFELSGEESRETIKSIAKNKIDNLRNKK